MDTTSSRLPELPACYGKSHVILLEVKPGLAHAFWEVTPEDARRVVEESGLTEAGAVWVLRFHEAAGAFDVEIDPAPGNWYVHLSSESHGCPAEIGIRTGSGGFVPVCSSLGQPLNDAALTPARAPDVRQPAAAPPPETEFASIPHELQHASMPHELQQAPSSFASPFPKA